MLQLSAMQVRYSARCACVRLFCSLGSSRSSIIGSPRDKVRGMDPNFKATMISGWAVEVPACWLEAGSVKGADGVSC